ncbi:hypothetical protein NLX83_23695 [Allokutzneria sp. A3M-2-11 16]|uniref:DddA-like double-stranded DNA deaminase toxin n=1 Tax=Allokutzneria sp. A3M-2-11 16 TaxID=2962043 RepID=UPI0020B81B2D|nr:DddA-like double-stranded DNA deaminase toxin [Allokutzneria sp. A3M-2-11 16]MCP3802278.1 hypothetical protein [Allokutzneria sp. A3M-2-11 16]
MSIRAEVAATARAAVAELPLDLVDVAEDALDETATTWDHATEGSPDLARDEVHGLLETAKDNLRAVRRRLRQLPARVESWITGLGGALAAVVEPPGEPSIAELVERARADLPPPVPKRQPSKTQKITHGRLLDEHGVIVGRLVSGTDTDSAEADRLITDAGFRQQLGIALHVELKALVRMRAGGQRHTTLLINNVPCPGPFGCDKMLPRLLRPGESLTVYGPEGYRSTYRRTAP